MTGETKKKTEPPLKLDMSFGEFLARALQTDPKEVEESIERAKTKKPPQEPQRRPERSRRQSEKKP
jgi:hypothetical protein